MTLKKFILSDITKKTTAGVTLYRIKALRSFSDVDNGDLGGFVEKESNLSHEGDCWVYDNAYVMGNSKVCEAARVEDTGMVCDRAIIKGSSRLINDSLVYGQAIIKDFAVICDDAYVCDYAVVCDNAKVGYDSYVKDTSIISGDAEIMNGSGVSGNSHVTDKAKLDGIKVRGNSLVSVDLKIKGNIIFAGNARITATDTFKVYKNYGLKGSNVNEMQDNITVYVSSAGLEVAFYEYNLLIKDFILNETEKYKDTVYEQKLNQIIEDIKQTFGTRFSI